MWYRVDTDRGNRYNSVQNLQWNPSRCSQLCPLFTQHRKGNGQTGGCGTGDTAHYISGKHCRKQWTATKVKVQKKILDNCETAKAYNYATESVTRSNIQHSTTGGYCGTINGREHTILKAKMTAGNKSSHNRAENQGNTDGPTSGNLGYRLSQEGQLKSTQGLQ